MTEEKTEVLLEQEANQQGLIIIAGSPFWPVMTNNIVAMICSTLLAVTFKSPWWVMAALPFIILANGYRDHDGKE